MRYIRTCCSCGFEQQAKDPKTYKDAQGKEPWRDLDCKRCGSNDLDYGTYKREQEDLEAMLAKGFSCEYCEEAKATAIKGDCVVCEACKL